MALKILIFLILNFGALAVGGSLMGEGPVSSWYKNLNQAPWTPPGWVFGAAWSTIMITFSVFMAIAWSVTPNKGILLALFALQWILNVSWNPVFFNHHLLEWGLLILVALTLLVGFMFIKYAPGLKAASLLIVPYLVWLGIATSLNMYIVLYNKSI